MTYFIIISYFTATQVVSGQDQTGAKQQYINSDEEATQQEERMV